MSSEMLFGLSYLFTKRATEDASELALLGWRFVFAVLAMGIWIRLRHMKIVWKGKRHKPVFLVALCCPVVYFLGETYGISMTTASESGAFLACIPVASLMASTWILGHRPHFFQVIGIIVTLLGVLATVVSVGMTASFSLPGYAFLLMAVIFYALYSVFVERCEEYTSMEITWVMLLCGAAVFVILALLESVKNGTTSVMLVLPFVKPHFLLDCLYQGVGCCVLAFFLSNAAIAKIGVNRTASFIGISTVVSILASVLILGEPFTLGQILGTVIIMAGVYIANHHPKEMQET